MWWKLQDSCQTRVMWTFPREWQAVSAGNRPTRPDTARELIPRIGIAKPCEVVRGSLLAVGRCVNGLDVQRIRGGPGGGCRALRESSSFVPALVCPSE